MTQGYDHSFQYVRELFINAFHCRDYWLITHTEESVRLLDGSLEERDQQIHHAQSMGRKVG